jgi:hypothetical protein
MPAGDNGGVMVQIKSKQERTFFANVMLNGVPDLLIAWAATFYLGTGVIGFFGVLIGLQCVYFLIWLKTCLWSWLLFWLSGRKKMVRGIEDALYTGRYPQPPEYVGDIEDYLTEVSKDPNVHPTVRTKAAADLGTMAGIKMSGRYSFGMQLHLAYEDALQEYARRFPPRQET